jgi:LPXTG-motif cell wall-anchored protein
MNTTALSSRARITGLVVAAGVTALVAAGSAASAAGDPAATEPPRALVWSNPICAGPTATGIHIAYDDYVDGHRPTAVHEELTSGSAVLWAADELHQVNGDYFNEHEYPGSSGATFDGAASYTYTVTITYDDGLVQSNANTLSPGAICELDSQTTTAPPPAPEPDRFQLAQGLYGCGTSNGGAFVEWSYGDYPDGHYAANFSLDLLKDGAVIEHHTTNGGDPTSDGAVTSFDVRYGDNPGAAFDPFFDQVTLQPASYSLSITVTYEDGATDKHIVTINLDDRCNGRVNGRSATAVAAVTTPPNPGSATTTTLPDGTLPETGSSNLTWVIGAVAGLLTTAGALFAGVRRSRND